MKKTKCIKKKSICVKLKTKCIKKKNKKKCVKKTICAKRKTKCVKRHKKTHKRYSGLPVKIRGNVAPPNIGLVFELFKKSHKKNTTATTRQVDPNENNIHKLNHIGYKIKKLNKMLEEYNDDLSSRFLIRDADVYDIHKDVYTNSNEIYTDIEKDLNIVISTISLFDYVSEDNNESVTLSNKVNKFNNDLISIKRKLVSFNRWLSNSSKYLIYISGNNNDLQPPTSLPVENINFSSNYYTDRGFIDSKEGENFKKFNESYHKLKEKQIKVVADIMKKTSPNAKLVLNTQEYEWQPHEWDFVDVDDANSREFALDANLLDMKRKETLYDVPNYKLYFDLLKQGHNLSYVRGIIETFNHDPQLIIDVGIKVKAKNKSKDNGNLERYYTGVIEKDNNDDTYEIKYNDGEVKQVPGEYIKAPSIYKKTKEDVFNMETYKNYFLMSEPCGDEYGMLINEIYQEALTQEYNPGDAMEILKLEPGEWPNNIERNLERDGVMPSFDFTARMSTFANEDELENGRPSREARRTEYRGSQYEMPEEEFKEMISELNEYQHINLNADELYEVIKEKRNAAKSRAAKSRAATPREISMSRRSPSDYFGDRNL